MHTGIIGSHRLITKILIVNRNFDKNFFYLLLDAISYNFSYYSINEYVIIKPVDIAILVMP